MEFLRSFLRIHFAGKPLVVSPNVGCFLGISIRLAPKLLKLLAAPPPKETPIFRLSRQRSRLPILLELLRKCNVLILINVSLVVSTTTKQSGIFLKVDYARRPL